MNDYRAMLKCHDVSSEISNCVKLGAEKLSHVISSYFDGYINDSYGDATKIFEKYKEQDILLNLSPEIEDISNDFISLFRGRKSDDQFNEITKDMDLFHPPFEKRYEVGTERYSAPGLPCLYLGQSAYICWVELDRPDLNKFVIARLRFYKNDLKFIDLSWRPIEVAAYIQMFNVDLSTEANVKQRVENYLKAWPLLMSCSIFQKDQGKKDVFKPEYIIPQFLLQWIRKAKPKIDGIKYFSTKVRYPKNINYNQKIDFDSAKFTKNYAIPVKKSAVTGYCGELQKVIRIGEPWSYPKMLINGRSAPLTVPYQETYLKFTS